MEGRAGFHINDTMEDLAGFDSLPKEMVLRILSLLSLDQLRVCAQVCHSWLSYCSCPSLWKSFTISIDTTNLHLLPTILDTPIFSQSSSLRFMKAILENRHLELVTTSPTIQHLDLQSCSVEGVWPEVLAPTVSSLSSLSLSLQATSPLSSPQKLQLFFQLSSPSCSLQHLSLCFVTLEEVPPRLLASSLGRIKKLRLRGNRLSPNQSIRLVESVAWGNMQELIITNNSLVALPHTITSTLPPHLTRLELTQCSMVPYHFSGLLASSCLPSSSLQHLSLHMAGPSHHSLPLLLWAHT